MIQHQQGDGLLTLFKNDGTESQFIKVLFEGKWSNGFTFSKCRSKSHCSLKPSKVYQYNHQTPSTTNTIFEYTKQPLTFWSSGIHLITQTKTSRSDLSLKPEVGESYNTAWEKHSFNDSGSIRYFVELYYRFKHRFYLKRYIHFLCSS